MFAEQLAHGAAHIHGAGGDEQTDVVADTVQQLLRDRCNDDSVAVKYEGRQWTWREHLRDATAAAAALLAIADPARPMHIGTLLPNTPDMLTQMAAAGLGGYVLCGINTTRRGDGLLADVRRADCQVLVTDAAHRPLLDGLDLTGIRLIDVSSDEWRRHLDAAGELRPYSEAGQMDTYMMIFTSGTSGNPKAVKVPHFMVLFAGQALAEKFELTPDDTCYLSMPLFHSNALGGWLGACSGFRCRNGAREVLGIELLVRHPPLRRDVHELRRQAPGLHRGHAGAARRLR